MSYIGFTAGHAYCSICQAILSVEEIDFECCDSCGGEEEPEDDEICGPLHVWEATASTPNEEAAIAPEAPHQPPKPQST